MLLKSAVVGQHAPEILASSEFVMEGAGRKLQTWSQSSLAPNAELCDILQVFGKTLLCKDLDVANIAAHRTHLNGITMAGDQVSKKGSFTGGFRGASR